MKKNRHAYLVIAHNNFEQLLFLIKLLDHSRNDIYLFIDEKVGSESFVELQNRVAGLSLLSSVFFTERISVNWGDYSQINAEMILFKAAFLKGSYAYYHLISGSDLPLVKQEIIHDFFDKNDGYQFLTMVDEELYNSNKVYERASFHYLWPNISDRSFKSKILGKLFQKCFRKIEVSCYRFFHIDHFSKYGVKLGYSSNWVSINEELVRIILNEEKWIYEVFSKSLLCDELFIPTIVYKYGLENKIYYDKGMKNSPGDFQGNLRFINWWDGSPYTWTDSSEDLEMLERCREKGYFFSRKFDIKKYPLIKDYIEIIVSE